MVLSPFSKEALAQAQQLIEKNPTLNETLERRKQESEQITMQPAGMAGIKELSLRKPIPPKYPEVYIPPVSNREAVYIAPTQEETIPGQKAPVMVPMEGNPNIPKDYQDLPTPPPPPDWTPPASPATNKVMHEVPPAPQTKKGNQVQLGMEPQVPPQQI